MARPSASFSRPPERSERELGCNVLGPQAAAGKAKHLVLAGRRLVHGRAGTPPQGLTRQANVHHHLAVFVGVGGFTYVKPQKGARALQPSSAAQDVSINGRDRLHTLNSTQTVAVADHTDDNDEHFMPHEYEFAVDGPLLEPGRPRNPIEGKAREQAWTGTAHALTAELGVGSVTASTLQIGFGILALAAALGATFVLLGAGLVWAGRRTT